MLDRLAGLADQKYRCGYEATVLRGPQARVVGEGDSTCAPSLPSSALCCVSLDGAKAALVIAATGP